MRKEDAKASSEFAPTVVSVELLAIHFVTDKPRENEDLMITIYPKSLLVLSLPIFAIAFQNCAVTHRDFAFSSTNPLFDGASCVTIEASASSCLEAQTGLVGRIHYLLDTSDGAVKPDYLYDRDNQPILFEGPELNSVNVILERGFVSPSYIVLPQVAVPVIDFSEGFKTGDGTILKDQTGKPLLEGFALDLRGSLRLGQRIPAGRYEIAILSDDGSILDLDIDQDGTLDSLIENDGYHSARFACSNRAMELSTSSNLPLRLRYYQGPRTQIALTVMMRALSASETAGMDPACGHTDAESSSWFTDNTNEVQLTTALKERGWFIPDSSMYALPPEL